MQHGPESRPERDTHQLVELEFMARFNRVRGIRFKAVVDRLNRKSLAALSGLEWQSFGGRNGQYWN
ncbi:hypothetical protein, partial [Mesorhizobium sp. M7A.F.Ca.US.006.04.2.1]|uniref:hypothetical protein n=1 Tax=Mesorhizobium sp. M7A.F.Ca.US.006.04.2.1 TaxID=2496696 RepID=UPI0019D4E5F1